MCIYIYIIYMYIKFHMYIIIKYFVRKLPLRAFAVIGAHNKFLMTRVYLKYSDVRYRRTNVRFDPNADLLQRGDNIGNM